MYEKLGRMVGRSYEETVQILIKALKNAESQGRCEIVLTLAKVVVGLGCAGQFTTIAQPIYNLPLSVFHSFFLFALLSSFFPFCLLIIPTCHFFSFLGLFPFTLSFLQHLHFFKLFPPGASVHRDIYKVARSHAVDRSMNVRCAAAKCLEALVAEASFVSTTELDSVSSLCFRCGRKMRSDESRLNH